MEIDESTWVRLVAKLISDTQDRKVKWRVFDALPSDPSLFGIPETINQAQWYALGRPAATYLCLFDDRAFRLDQFEGGGLLNIGKYNYKLSISKVDGKILKSIPTTSGLYDLMNAIDKQLGQVESFIEKYLSH